MTLSARHNTTGGDSPGDDRRGPSFLKTERTNVPGDHLDLTSDPHPDGPSRNGQSPTGAARTSAGEPAGARAFVGIRFACCDVYARIYVNKERTAYLGHCPRCGKGVELKISPDGVDSRFFTAY